MSSDFRKPAPRTLYRIARDPDGLSLLPWEYAQVADRLNRRTFGGRWDDPERVFRSLETASTLHGAFVEALADLRPDDDFLASLDAIELERGERARDYRRLDASFLEGMYVCELGVVSQNVPFADVASEMVITIMRNGLAKMSKALGIEQIDPLAMHSGEREFTQGVARILYAGGYAGVMLSPTPGRPYQRWALFEAERETNMFRIEIVQRYDEPVALDNSDLIEALNILHVRLTYEATLLHANPQEFS